MFIWYAAGAVVAVAIAWLAAVLHTTGSAPIGLVSLGVGIALGASLTGIAASLRLAGHRALLIGTIALALVTVATEHAWLYHDFRRQWQAAREKSPEVAMFRAEAPWSPREYFGRETTRERAALWLLDAVLITAAAAVTVIAWQRKRE